MCERYVSWLSLARPQLGTWPVTQACLEFGAAGGVSRERVEGTGDKREQQRPVFLVFNRLILEKETEICCSTHWLILVS